MRISIMQVKRNKYHVAPAAERTVDGIRFASKAEMKRWMELKLLERAGVIKDLERQPAYVVLDPFIDEEGKKHRGVKYIADFRYEMAGRVVIVEDVKGHFTEAYRIKREMFRKRYPGVVFREIKVGKR
jgi:hypothetical protein